VPKDSREVDAEIISQTKCILATDETQEVIVQSHGDEVVDCSAAVKDRSPRLVRVLGTSQ